LNQGRQKQLQAHHIIIIGRVKLTVNNRDIIRLAAPISFSLLIPQLNFLTNTAFLGRLGEMELGVNGITGVFYLILSMVGYGLSSGIQVLMSRRAGENNITGLSNSFTNGIMLSLMFSLGLMVLSLWLAPLIFGLSLHDDMHTSLAVRFIYIRVWGLPFLILTQLLNAFFIVTNRSKYLVYGSLVGTVVNIVFDYLLIFGKGGFAPMGLDGAAVASIISEAAAALVMVIVFFARRLHHTYSIFSGFRFDMELSQRALNISAPLIVQFLFSIGGWQIFFIYVEHLGQSELAASQMLRSIFGIVSVGTWALASACNTMVSNLIGQGKQSRVPGLIIKISKLSFLYALGVCVLLLLFSYPFLSIYGGSPQLIELAVPSLRIIVVATLIMALSTVMFNGVAGTGNTRMNLIIEVTCVLTYLVYCYFVIEKYRMGLAWAWGSEFVYWSSLFITSFLYLRSGKWKGKEI
jgi:multidrug resistance protein, MATE family